MNHVSKRMPAMSKILVVDDSEVARMQVVGILEEAGYKVLDAPDGEEGIKQAAANSDIKMILSDYNMPDMNGLDMLEIIKEKPEHADTYCGILTTETSEALKERGKSIGVKFWIVKPIDAKNLLKVAKMIMEKTK